MVQGLMVEFLVTARQQACEIEAAVAASDMSGAASAAHRIRSGALAVGAAELARVAGALEAAARSGDGPACRAMLGPLTCELSRAADK
jgi:HPt (histidine-containing phosphotransfer) domain-containing protein